MRKLLIAVACMLALNACGKKEEVKPLTPKEAAEVQARAYNFQVFPGAVLLEEVTDLMRRGSLVAQPHLTEPPPTAVYDTDAPLEEVAEFYRKAYGYARIAPNAQNELSSAKPMAYYFTGDVAADLNNLTPVLQKMNLKIDASKATGTYKAAYFAPTPSLPRVSIQRPYFNLATSQMVDRTVIVLVRE